MQGILLMMQLLVIILGLNIQGIYGIPAFCFEKNGASVVIMVTPDFDFENDVEKIIG